MYVRPLPNYHGALRRVCDIAIWYIALLQIARGARECALRSVVHSAPGVNAIGRLMPRVCIIAVLVYMRL